MSFPEDGLDAGELKGFALHAAHHYAETLFARMHIASPHRLQPAAADGRHRNSASAVIFPNHSLRIASLPISGAVTIGIHRIAQLGAPAGKPGRRGAGRCRRCIIWLTRALLRPA